MEGTAEGRNSWPMPAPRCETELIERILDENGRPFKVLDPFCGSGAVPLACAVRGWDAVGLESNPFLRWAASIRLTCFASKAAEHVGYAWARVAEDVFWENGQYRLPAMSGTLTFGPKQEDFLRRVRFMIDKENRDGMNDLLRISFCRSLRFVHDSNENVFDDRMGNDICADSVEVIRSSVMQNPEATSQVHLCDSRDIPCAARRKYDLIVSVLPEISPNPDAKMLKTCMQWIGFTDIERADDTAIGYPLGDFGRYMENYMPDSDFPVPNSLSSAISDMEEREGLYVRRYFEGLRDYLVSSRDVMAPGCNARYIVRGGKMFGKSIPVTEIIAEIAEGSGFSVSAEKCSMGSSLELHIRTSP